MQEPNRRLIEVGEAVIDVATWGSGDLDIVLLHDGLGSIDQFGEFPAILAEATGATVTAYDRPGHGRSTPVPSGPWPADWLHTQADLLRLLLAELDIAQPVLVGHSDGGSIALIHAAARPDSIQGLVTLAAHSYVEQVCVDRITAMREERKRWVRGLSRFHKNAAATFEAWSGVWVGPAFRPWDIRCDVGAITSPTLVVQGDMDEYATPEHATSTTAAIGGHARCHLLPGLGHLLPQQAPADIAALIASVL